MGRLILSSFEGRVVGLVEHVVDVIEELERHRRDAKTTALLVSARRLYGDVLTYFNVGGAA